MFKALLLDNQDGKTKATLTQLAESQLPAGEVRVAVSYSSLNYKDGLAITGKGKIVRQWPLVPGIDFVGTVLESADSRYQSGDKVVLTGWGVGEGHWGGMAEQARVKADWLVPLPAGLDERQAMCIGTAGLTAMLCVLALEEAGVTPASGEILVTGAAGGVGSTAVALLAELGYSVAALTGRPEEQGECIASLLHVPLAPFEIGLGRGDLTFRLGNVERSRVIEALEVALRHGGGRLRVYALPAEEGGESQTWPYSVHLDCPESGAAYSAPIPSMFSFNSAMGACETCRGFGRVIGVDWGLVIPDEKLTLRQGAIKPIQTPAWSECQDDLMRHAEMAGIPRDTPWNRLTASQRRWVIDGTPDFKEGNWNRQWYGIQRFFTYLESKAYKMHIRVLLSKYRSYTECPACQGARLKTESLLWRVGSKADADAVLAPPQRFMPAGVNWSRGQLENLPGLCLHDLMLLPISRLHTFFERLAQDTPLREQDTADLQARKLLFGEINTRLRYLCDVGIGYLTLDRQSRTLSGGEVQRINLTTALGTSLVNTLFVLDEPSIGLHPRDMHRITEAMLRLRDAGNTLVVVEHDPAVMLAADRMIDMGPGPGRKGGSIVFDGTTADLRQADTLTGNYLGGRKQVGFGFKRMVTDSTPRLILEGAREHNLKDVSVEFPLQRLVTVTGVSGSGKSSLIQDVLAPALMRHFGKATEAPGAHDRLLGADHLADVVFVDQSPIGKTARSNPVSYVGAWDSIRELFATAPLSRQRSYTAAKFSFNSGDGRCPTCGGSGFEHVEMQFLSDVYLRCPDCDGKRYRPEILEITIERGGKTLNVADVLELTVAEAVALFAGDKDVVRALQPIVDVGLDYVALGQPVPTLSGGEAQRLKLAGFLAEAAKTAAKSRQNVARKGTLFLFDEPTTGLHFDDIAKLMRALRKLLEAGHSLIVIEHNLDVIRASDWLIDLGPEGGEGGGLIVAEGTPEDVREHATSHTGQALRDYELALGVGGHSVHEKNAVLRKKELLAQEGQALQANLAKNAIEIVNAKEHNLKSLSVDVPRGKFNVITGVSGSGKSTLAFDILFNEGQRRYLESLNAYARSKATAEKLVQESVERHRGMTCVILTGGIDLSVGSIVALAAVVATSFAHPDTYPVAVPIALGLGVGAAIGLLNGVIIAKGAIAPFVVTLGMMTMARGAGLVFSSGRPIINLSDEYNSIGGGYFLGIPIPIFLFVGVLLAGIFLLRFARFGRHVYAVGGNEQASKLSGLNTGRIKIAVYGLSGLFSGFAGVLLSSRVMTGSPVAGVGYELDAIAAVVIGGSSLSGGAGSIYGTIIGTLIIGIMNNGLDLLNVSSYYQQIVKGSIIIGALLLDINRKK